MMTKVALAAIGFLAWSGAALGGEFALECHSPIQSFSNIDKMNSGDFSANVLWKDVKLSSTSIGYGPSANRQYELTVLDGKVFMARPSEGEKVILRTDPKPNEGAAMLQVVTPKNWTPYRTMPDVFSFEGLNFELDDIVENSGCGEDLLIPFKIKGHAKSLVWSMDTDNHRVVTTKNQDVELVGIYNLNKKGKYFMVKGFNIHVHVFMPKLKQAGHLRDIQLDEGATLYLPKKI